MIIGITGSSGSGKSTVCDILESKYNVKIINADKIAKQLSKKGNEYLSDIVKEFGEDILLENKELDRTKLANIIYNDANKREKLNLLTFKHVCKKIKEEIEDSIKRDPNKTIGIDAPLLLEANLQELCDITIAVISDDKEMQIKRIVERDKIERQQAIDRLNAQQDNDFYMQRCDYIIKNNGTDEDLEEQVKDIIKKRKRAGIS